MWECLGILLVRHKGSDEFVGGSKDGWNPQVVGGSTASVQNDSMNVSLRFR